MRKGMRNLALMGVVASIVVASPALAKDTQFWNLTADKIMTLQLSPAGKNIWGKNQTDNDPDRSVDADERLKITDTPSGTYDVRFKDEQGRTCTVPGVTIVAGERFAIKENQLKGCTQ